MRASLKFIFAALLPLVGCNRAVDPGSDLAVHSALEPTPARTGLETVRFTLSDSHSKPIAAATVALEGDMSHPGMAPVFGDAKEIEPGRYTGRLTFSMPGDWVILFHVRLANGTKVERQIEIRGVKAN